MRAFGEHHIYKRKNPSGTEVYVVRIRDILEPTGLWYNQTFKTIEIAREARDEMLAKQKATKN